jgi:ssDNA thymidine ADP-ribosyltransferase, DarT
MRMGLLRMAIPEHPKLYHIVHVDRLRSIVADGCLWSDAEMLSHAPCGTTIGMSGIKERRLTELVLSSHPDLHVGDCVPFYFCPRSIMLYLIYQGNHRDMTYRGGQGPIIHLEADLYSVVKWADDDNCRWAFTLTNAGSRYFDDHCDLANLNKIKWEAVQARDWTGCKDGKQAEFLVECSFPWSLVERIGVRSEATRKDVLKALPHKGHLPVVEIRRDWYY